MNDDRVYQVYYGEKGDEATRILTRMRVNWVVDRVPQGRVLDIGCSQGIGSVLLAERGATVTGIDNELPALEFAERVRSELEPETRQRIELVEADAHDLPFAAKSFDHAVCSEVLEHVEDPGRVIEEIFRVLAPSGKLVATVPLGILPHPDHRRVFYADALNDLLDPMFRVDELETLERHLGIVGERRARAKRRPAYGLSAKEVGLLEHERDLRAQLQKVKQSLTDTNLKYRDVTASAAAERGRLAEALKKAETAEEDLKAEREAGRLLRTKIERLEAQVGERQPGTSMAGAGAHGLQRRAHVAKRRERLLEVVIRQETALGEIEGRLPQVRANLDLTNSAGERARAQDAPAPLPIRRPAPVTETDDFEQWRRRAAAAAGDEVIFMYSGTIHMQEKRGNRPIRLTRVYLERERPVFFNYWRWRKEDPPPEWSHPLLFQSPVDVTPSLLDRLLEADFGGKRKLMFASFPHELMVRALSRAVQRDWVTIYDARDDWEEFHKVGMAKWYDPGFEEFLIRHSDVVTAVSRPLARKLCEMGNRHDIEVVANALDSQFPSPSGPREPSDPPRVGYFGHLTPKWFDWDLVLSAARQHPTWSFELAGHQAPDDLSLPENVKLLGLLGHGELAALSRRWSFAIIPFKLSALGEAVDPIKVYEYLHLGLPVLATYMPQMRNYPATAIAESQDDFLALLPAMRDRVVDPQVVKPWLAANTWEVRVERYSELAKHAQLARRELAGVKGLLALR